MSPFSHPEQATENSVHHQTEKDPFVRNLIHHIPSFVLDHAPLVHLHTQEPFWPASHESHLRNTTLVGEKTAELNLDQPRLPYILQNTFAPTPNSPFHILAHRAVNHEECFMTARVDVRAHPRLHPWLVSEAGRPDPDGRSALSPATLILVDKSDLTGVPNTLDAFWFFFHSFNLGPTIAKIHFGNHIADWEHCMMRFVDGQPKAVHLSSHADGFAYTYDCLQKSGLRPVIYSAYGSHAMYPKPGAHDYSPIKLLGPIDRTDRGPLWDPRLNYKAFQHFPSPAKDKFRAINEELDGDFVACLQFRGGWGDQYSGPDQRDLVRRSLMLDKLRWGDGVTGPRDKDLDRIGMNRSGNLIRTFI